MARHSTQVHHGRAGDVVGVVGALLVGIGRRVVATPDPLEAAVVLVVGVDPEHADIGVLGEPIGGVRGRRPHCHPVGQEVEMSQVRQPLRRGGGRRGGGGALDRYDEGTDGDGRREQRCSRSVHGDLLLGRCDEADGGLCGVQNSAAGPGQFGDADPGIGHAVEHEGATLDLSRWSWERPRSERFRSVRSRSRARARARPCGPAPPRGRRRTGSSRRRRSAPAAAGRSPRSAGRTRRGGSAATPRGRGWAPVRRRS